MGIIGEGWGVGGGGGQERRGFVGCGRLLEILSRKRKAVQFSSTRKSCWIRLWVLMM